ncbi:MAG: hypothetical protein SPL96_05295 [Bacteroidales bacterium]|nr:hypothetical protein [Bacteroidales bacterium]
MNGKTDNSGFRGFQSVLNLRTAYWRDKALWDLSKQIATYLEGLDDVPPLIPVDVFFDLFRKEDFSDPSLLDFNSLSDEQKVFIGMIDLSGQYMHCLSTICAHFLEQTHRIFMGDVSDHEANGEDPNFEVTIEEIEDDIDDAEEDVPLDNEEDVPLDNEEITEEDENNNHDADTSEDSQDNLSDHRIPPFNIKTLPKIYPRSLISYSTTPPLRKVFNHLTQIRQSFHFLLEWFYNYFGPVDQIPLDYMTYNRLYESIVKKDFELFSDLVYDWNDTIVNQLSIIVELIYPMLHYVECQTQDLDTKIDIIKKDLTFDSRKEKYRLPFSPLNVLFNFIIIYIFRNIVERYLELYQRMMQYIVFADYTNSSIDIFFRWVDNEMELFFDFFRNNHDSLLNNTIETTKINSNNLEGEEPPQEPGSNGGNDDQSVDTIDQPEDPKPEPIEIPDFIKVPCGQRMLDKLINGLINGHKDDTLGKIRPLVSSKTGEDKESIKKKLICLFTGEGINDESIKWPYDLKWNDHANSLKLLVYLLYFTGELPDEEGPFATIDETQPGGIAELVKTNFRGKNVWPIVGPALGYGKDYLRSNVKIPKESNINLMKMLAQFWYDCKILGD